MNVIKRDGSEQEFDITKIVTAINKASQELYHKDFYRAEDIAMDVEDYFDCYYNSPTVEQIQDMVETELMEYDPDLARSYIRYRYKREVAREANDEFMRAIEEKLTARNVQNQNANVDEASFGGRIGEASSVMTKQYALDYLVSPMARANHLNNEVYIHDLDAYAVGSHNCLSIPFDDILAKGFNTRQTDVRPANSVNTAM